MTFLFWHLINFQIPNRQETLPSQSIQWSQSECSFKNSSFPLNYLVLMFNGQGARNSVHFYDNCFYCRPDNPYFILRMCDIIESTFHLLLLSTFSLCFSMNLAETKIGPKITKQKNFSARHCGQVQTRYGRLDFVCSNFFTVWPKDLQEMQRQKMEAFVTSVLCSVLAKL